jgi:hypothetical protein
MTKLIYILSSVIFRGNPINCDEKFSSSLIIKKKFVTLYSLNRECVLRNFEFRYLLHLKLPFTFRGPFFFSSAGFKRSMPWWHKNDVTSSTGNANNRGWMEATVTVNLRHTLQLIYWHYKWYNVVWWLMLHPRGVTWLWRKADEWAGLHGTASFAPSRTPRLLCCSAPQWKVTCLSVSVISYIGA